MNIFIILQAIHVTIMATAGVFNYLNLLEIKNQVQLFRQEMYAYTEYVMTQTARLDEEFGEGFPVINPGEPYCVPCESLRPAEVEDKKPCP